MGLCLKKTGGYISVCVFSRICRGNDGGGVKRACERWGLNMSAFVRVLASLSGVCVGVCLCVCVVAHAHSLLLFVR